MRQLNFYQLCFYNDYVSILKYIVQSSIPDGRKSNNNDIIEGFYGIHYSIVNRSIDVFRTLLPRNYKQKTQKSFFSPNTYVKNILIPPKTDIIQLCVLFDFREGIEEIIRFYQKKNIKFRHKNFMFQYEGNYNNESAVLITNYLKGNKLQEEIKSGMLS